MSSRSDLAWVDAFPVLTAIPPEVDQDGLVWIGKSPAESGIEVGEFCAWMAEVAIWQLPGWRLDQLFAFIDPDTRTETLIGLNTRARNVLLRFHGSTLAATLSATVKELFDLPNLGTLTATNIIQVLAALNWTAAQQGGRAPDRAVSHRQPPALEAAASGVDLYHHFETLEGAIRAINLLVTWQRARGRVEEPLLDPGAAVGAPADVQAAFQLLTTLRAMDVDPEAPDEVATVLDGILEELDERELIVARARLFAAEPETLDQIGRRIGVTRERVRQIEGRLKSKLSTRDVSAFTTRTGPIAAAVRQFVGPFCSLERLFERFPALTAEVPLAGQPAWRVLDWLDDEFEVVEQWAFCPSSEAVGRVADEVIEQTVNEYGTVSLAVLAEALGSRSLVDGELVDLVRWWGFEIFEGHVLTMISNLGDRAAAVLSVRGQPMTAEEIISSLEVERSVTALKNVLAQDDRFTRTDRETWALEAWGLDAYTGLKDMIRRAVEGSEGVPLSELVEDLTSRFSVSANSVIAYASASPFRVQDGVVALAEPQPPAARKPPERTRRLYRGHGEWLYRMTVNSDHMRGSGFPVPVGLAAVCGLEPGGAVALPSSLGEQNLTWKAPQPACGTIRRFLERDDVEAGRQLLLRISDDGRFDVTVVRSGGTPQETLAALLGLPGTSALRAGTALALGLDEGASWADIMGRAHERREVDLVDLIGLVNDESDIGLAPAGAKAPTYRDILDLM